ncbi:hypothetical protein T492DRAFT_1008518 [Pavlovales sp. CCMP2436]|nr:hypothetical protein T492DRAFT_1008518 [Pavlovales sp. CCMP2436]
MEYAYNYRSTPRLLLGTGGACLSPGRSAVHGREHVRVRRRERRAARRRSSPLTPDDAARRIQRAFTSHRDAVLFQLIRTELRRAEFADGAGSLSKVSPAEARLLGDPALGARVRWRLGGESFPPQVFYRVFTTSQTRRLDGRMLELDKGALRDARRLMGVRRFNAVHGGPALPSAHLAHGSAGSVALGPGPGRVGVDRWHRLGGVGSAPAGLHLAPGYARADLTVRTRLREG